MSWRFANLGAVPAAEDCCFVVLVKGGWFGKGRGRTDRELEKERERAGVESGERVREEMAGQWGERGRSGKDVRGGGRRCWWHWTGRGCRGRRVWCLLGRTWWARVVMLYRYVVWGCSGEAG